MSYPERMRPYVTDLETDLFARRGNGGQYPSIVDRLEVGDCWAWTGSTNGTGYGLVSILNKPRLVHRVVWESLVGPIATDMTLDHLCLNTRCVNPDHLEIVSASENQRRAYRERTHCPHGHEFTPENSYLPPDGIGRRQCLKCRRTRDAKHNAKRKTQRTTEPSVPIAWDEVPYMLNGDV